MTLDPELALVRRPLLDRSLNGLRERSPIVRADQSEKLAEGELLPNRRETEDLAGLFGEKYRSPEDVPFPGSDLSCFEAELEPLPIVPSIALADNPFSHDRGEGEREHRDDDQEQLDRESILRRRVAREGTMAFNGSPDGQR